MSFRRHCTRTPADMQETWAAETEKLSGKCVSALCSQKTNGIVVGFFLKAAQKRAQCERSLLEMSAGAGGNEWLEPRCEFVRVRKSEGCAAVCMLHLVKCQRNLLPATGTQ